MGTPPLKDSVFLVKGDTFDMRALNESGPTALRGDGPENWFAINKINVGN